MPAPRPLTVCVLDVDLVDWLSGTTGIGRHRAQVKRPWPAPGRTTWHLMPPAIQDLVTLSLIALPAFGLSPARGVKF